MSWSKWATPVVPVVKQNGTVRIYGAFKVTVYSQLKFDQTPLLLIDDVFATCLTGEQKFSKIDLRLAYTQIEMTYNSKPMLMLNTHGRLFRLNRLPLGIATAPAALQRAIDIVLSRLLKTRCIIDDINVTGADDEEHFRNLYMTLPET